jgi:hypothetical protein
MNKPLILNNLDEIDDFCRTCGSCCRNLVLLDKIELFLSAGIIVIGKICKYSDLSSKGGCKIYHKKPKCCSRWTCGVPQLLTDRYNLNNAL